MQVAARLLKADDLGRNLVAVPAAGIDEAYRNNRSFWTARHKTRLTEEDKKSILRGQSGAVTPHNRGAIEKLYEIYEKSAEQGTFSMLEIGAANGTVLRQIERRFPKPKLTYVGFECLPVLVDDFKERYPEQTMHLGAVEDFIAADDSLFEAAPFDLFYASVALIMIKPDLVRQALAKAAGLTDQFLIYDFVEDVEADPGPDEALILHVPDRPVFWFIHPWDDYLAEVGFEIIDKAVGKATPAEEQSPSYDPLLRGCGYVHAVRK